MGFWVGNWLHDSPGKEYDSTGKRAIIRHLCFGPAETQIWYKSADGQYYYELHIIEGLQAGDIFLDQISTVKMLEAINTEIDLCKRLGKTELAAIFQTEKEKIEEQICQVS